MDRDFVLALLRLAVFLPLVLALAYVTVRLGAGRVGSRIAGPGRLEVVERLPLGSKSGLAVVRCGERYFLIGLGEGAPVFLTELPDYPAAAAGEIPAYPLSYLGEEEGENGAMGPWDAQRRKKHGN
ncbi:MAG: flagellar biosynthetic protein FliO [Moorella humiferrea]|uniref:flagellar biosynthetic protein FliO n=1 Tax=Neomoorella humiferrea TaxID=676965 RepID=UPI0019F2E320|nr:flagellar biosynthetic protein FliO [Moorella humiferrea]